MKELVVRATNFGVILGGLPENIGDLVNLEVFDMKNARMTTKLPFSMVNMRKLRTINFTHNVVFTDILISGSGDAMDQKKKQRGLSKTHGAERTCRKALMWNTLEKCLVHSDSQTLESTSGKERVFGYPDNYVGSILEMPADKCTTPYIWIDNDEVDEDEETNEKCGQWIRAPLLMRSMGMRPAKMWYGVEYM